MGNWIIAVSFIVIGIVDTLFIHRIGRWWGRLGFHLHERAPWLNFTGKTKEEVESQFYNSWPLRGYWLFWVWSMRIIGVGLTIFGAIALYALITQS